MPTDATYPPLRPTDDALARSANLPLDEQRRLARSSRPEVIAALSVNPALAESVQRSLLRQRGQISSILVRNPSLAPSLQRQLAVRGSADVRRALAEHPALDPRVQVALLERDDPAINRSLSSNPAVTEEAQQRLGASDEGGILGRLARNPGSGTELLHRLARDRRWRVRAAAADNQRLPQADQIRLGTDRSIAVRRSLAGNPMLCVDGQRMLVSEQDLGILARLANASMLDHGVAADLSAASQDLVRWRLALNPAISESIQVRLAGDEPIVAAALAANPALAEPAQWALLPRDFGVRIELARNRMLTAPVQRELARDHEREVRASVARLGDDPEVMRRLARDADEHVRRAVAAETTAAEIHEVLSTDQKASVRSSLACNRHIADHVLLRLAQDSSLSVLAQVARHPRLSRAPLVHLMERLSYPHAGDRYVRHVLRRRKVLGSATFWKPQHLDDPFIGPLISALSGKRTVQRAACVHDDQLVRLALAGNEKLRADALDQLLQDEDGKVAAAARQRMLTAMARL